MNQNRKGLFLPMAALAVGCAAMLALSSCADKTDKETDTSGGTGTAAETEAVTAVPRYDYMEAVISPDVTLDKADYTDIALTLPAGLKVTDQSVQDYIQKSILFTERVADHGTDRMTDKPMKKGDSAFIYYKGFRDGKEFEGGSNWDDKTAFELGLGSGSFIPGFEEGLIGVIPADTSRDKPVEVPLTFPKDYHNAELAGKAVVFRVYVEYAVQYTLPEYTRDFVVNTLKYKPKKDFYASDEALLDEFEQMVREKLEDDIKGRIEEEKLGLLWEFLTGKAECRNLPQSEIDYYFDSYKSELEYYYDTYKTSGGPSFTERYPTMDAFAVDYLGLKDGEKWQDELKKHSEEMVCKSMIIHAIGEREGIESVTDEQYQAEIKYWTDYYQGYMTADEIVKNMGEVFLRESAYVTKMEKWLLDRCVFTYADDEPGEETETGGGSETESEPETTGKNG